MDQIDPAVHSTVRRIRKGCIAPIVAASILSIPALADWPQFRGPSGAGVADGGQPPVEFGPDKNLIWRIAVPGAPSSPCIAGDHIYLTAFADGKLETLCVRRKDGKILWRQSAPHQQLEAFHPSEGSPASATPATDGKRVVVYFASYGLVGYDAEGRELWKLPMPIPSQAGDFGSGCSPILVEGLVLLNRDQLQGSELLAVDAAQGTIVWRAPRPECSSSFGTPVFWSNEGVGEVVLPGQNRMKAYDLKTGKERWTLRGLPTAVCTTPVVGDGLLIFAGWSPGKSDSPMPPFANIAETQDKDKDGIIAYEEAEAQWQSFFSSYDINRDRKLTQQEWDMFLEILARGENVALAVRPGGQGDITESHVAWKYNRGLPYVASPLAYRDRLYFVKDGGLLTCLQAASGQVVFAQERLGAPGNYYASPVAADGKIYCTALNGTIVVVRAGDTLEVLARNNLSERTAATPAIVDDRLYVRTDQHLYAFGNRP